MGEDDGAGARAEAEPESRKRVGPGKLPVGAPEGCFGLLKTAALLRVSCTKMGYSVPTVTHLHFRCRFFGFCGGKEHYSKMTGDSIWGHAFFFLYEVNAFQPP